MFLISKLRKQISVASPFLIHVLMVLSVAAYTLFGAYSIRALENKHINEVNQKNGFAVETHRPKRSALGIVLTGPELAAVAPGLRPCVQKALKSLLFVGNCNSTLLRTISITAIDDCYRNAEIDLNQTFAANSWSKVSNGNAESEGWTLHNSLVFAFTIITTIGYGNVAPETLEGRIFCLFYGLIGVPLALLTIADIGMFLNKLVQYISKRLVSLIQKLRNDGNLSSRSNQTIEIKEPKTEEESEDGDSMVSEKRETSESAVLGLIFGLYLLVGSFVISLYEPDMDYFRAVYFNFISLTTIGLGDLVPKRSEFLILTFAYLTVGLALTTMAIEIAADLLKKIHYFGRKIEDVASVDIWFGGKKMKLKNLVRHLGDQLNIPVEELDKFDIKNFVADSMKVADGEMKSLRKQLKPVNFEDVSPDKEAQPDFADDSLLSYTSEESPLHTARSGDADKLLKQSQSAR